MRKDTRPTILAACRHLIRPLARLLLRHGIGYKEFSEVCKVAFVEVASEDYGVRGRAANLSKIAILTGLSRKEAKKIRDSISSGPELSDQHGLSPASMVLRGWYSDPLYKADDGKPLPLALGGSSPNLTTLVQRYAGDLPVSAVIRELKRVGAVESMPSGRIRLAGKSFIPPNVDGQLFASGAASIHNLIATVANNVSPGRDTNPRFERYAWSNHLPESAVQSFHALVAEKGMAFLEYLTAWLKKYEKTSDNPETQILGKEVGVGVYFYDVTKDQG